MVCGARLESREALSGESLVDRTTGSTHGKVRRETLEGSVTATRALRRAMHEIAARKGSFTLFALFMRADAPLCKPMIPARGTWASRLPGSIAANSRPWVNSWISSRSQSVGKHFSSSQESRPFLATILASNLSSGTFLSRMENDRFKVPICSVWRSRGASSFVPGGRQRKNLQPRHCTRRPLDRRAVAGERRASTIRATLFPPSISSFHLASRPAMERLAVHPD
jgi:hypothetical protein